MLDQLISIDKQLFMLLNGWHTQWLDPIMFWISGKKEWIPFYIFLVSFIIYKYKWDAIFIFLGIGITILLTDQITSSFMKPFFERLRPSHDPDMKDAIHLVKEYRGGLYGFASSHAANTFGIATFIWLALKNNYKWTRLLFLWALLVSYSRIYLGVHYPGDIIAGGVVGFVVAYLAFRLYTLRSLFMKKLKVGSHFTTY